MPDTLLYDQVIELINRNEFLYDRWENQIASCISKIWIQAFEVAKETSGSENPTLTEIADMGAVAVNDSTEFLSDITDIFRKLSRGAQLNSNGEWCLHPLSRPRVAVCRFDTTNAKLISIA